MSYFYFPTKYDGHWWVSFGNTVSWDRLYRAYSKKTAQKDCVQKNQELQEWKDRESKR